LDSTETEPPFDVLWRTDSKYFAIKWEETRGWMTGTVYGISKDGHWVEVKMPEDKYENAIKKIGGISNLYGKGCDSPVQWLPNGDLDLEFVDRNLVYEHEGDFEKEFVVSLRVEARNGNPLRMAKVVSIRQKSKDEVNKELQANDTPK